MNHIKPRRCVSAPRCAGAALIIVALIGLGGCGGGGGEAAPGGRFGSRLSMALVGDVHGGQNPVSGAQVFAYQAGSGGYGKGDLKIACTTTNAGGQFNFGSSSPACAGAGLPATLSCPATGSPLLYLLAVGGNPGAGANAALALMAAVGSCNSLPASSFVAINEVTTVAAVWTLSHFMNCTGGSVNGIIAGCTSNSRDVGTSASNAAGLNNAMGLVGSLVNPGTGVARGASLTGMTPPTAEVNTLANILQDCVNSTGAAATACVDLFSCVTPGAKPGAGNSAPCTLPAGAIAPGDTLTAALDIARNPVNNVAALFNLTSKAPAFTPALGAAPNDWTVSLNYAGGGLSFPEGVAIDATGAAWVANNGGNSVTRIGPGGNFLTGGSGLTGGFFNGPDALAIDGNGNVWIVNGGGGANSVSEFDPMIGFFQQAGLTGGGLLAPAGIAIDKANNVWVSNAAGNSLTEINSLGGFVLSGLTGGGLNAPMGVAIDAAGNVWMANNQGNSLTEVTAGGIFLSGTGITGGGLNAPFGIAIDLAGNVWAANNNAGVSKFSSAGVALSGSGGFAGGGLSFPNGIAVDAAGNVWVTNLGNNTITEMGPAGNFLSGPNGFVAARSSSPFGVALDASGNVWITNEGNKSLTELVGIGTPVVTPITACLKLNTGHAVCLP